MQELTNRTFTTTVSSQGVVLVDFSAPWCRPCQAVAPVLDSLQEEYGDNVLFCKVDTDEHSALAAENEVTSLPFFQLWKDGQLLNTFSGAFPKAKFKSILDGVLAPA